MKYRAVIFDLFGTLVDNFLLPEYNAVLDRLAAILGVAPDDFQQWWRDSFDDRCSGKHPDQRAGKMNVPVTEQQLEEAFRVRLAYTAGSLKPRPDTIATIEAVRGAGLKTALVSDCTGEVPILWPDSPFGGLFDATIFSCRAGVKKPDPRIYHLATDAIGVKPEECLYVGDGSSSELTGARAVGMHAVLILDPNETVDTHYVKREENWNGDRIAYLSELLPLLGLDTGVQ